MKHLKKFASLLLAALLVFGLTTTAFAATNPTPAPMQGTLTGGSITINNAVEGYTYRVFQILYLESYDADAGAYSYKANSLWESWLREHAAAYFQFDGQGYVTWIGNDDTDVVAFARLALDHAKEATGIQPSVAPITATSTTVVFDNLNLGYYLVDSTLGTLCSLDTTIPNVTMQEKNAEPTNNKEVEENPGNTWGKVNDANIGDTVNFRSTVTLPAGSENVVYHDTMSAGLTLNADSIKVYTDAEMTTELAGNYSVTITDHCTFEVVFDQDYLNGLTATATVYVGYSAVINESAVIGGNGNTNTSHLSYGDANDTTTHQTPPSTTTTYVWAFGIHKYGNGNEENDLSGAKFVLLNEDKDKVATIVNGKLTGWVNVPTDVPPVPEISDEADWPANTVLTTEEDGMIHVDGLDSGTYYLREIKAPDGYNMLNDYVSFTINPTDVHANPENPTSPVIGLTWETQTIPVNNNSGTQLPGTGGIGTTIFYVVGSILLVGAVVLLVTKKRMSATK